MSKESPVGGAFGIKYGYKYYKIYNVISTNKSLYFRTVQDINIVTMNYNFDLFWSDSNMNEI